MAERQKYILPEKYVQKFLEQYNLYIVNKSISKPVVQIKDMPKVFTQLYLLTDKKLQDKFDKIIAQLGDKCQVVNGLQVIKPFAQLSKSLASKLTEETKAKFVEQISQYQPKKREEVAEGKQEDFQLKIKFFSKVDKDIQHQLKLIQCNKYMMQIYNKIKKNNEAELKKCNRSEAKLESTFKNIIERMTADKETQTTNSKTQKTYTRVTQSCIHKYEAIYDSINSTEESEFDLQNKFTNLYTEYTKEHGLQKTVKTNDLKILGAQILNEVFQQYDSRLSTIYNVKLAESKLKQYVLNHNKTVKDINNQLKELVPGSEEHKKLTDDKDKLQAALADMKEMTQFNILSAISQIKALNVVEISCDITLKDKKPKATANKKQD